jgi:hypothetical protein
MDMQEFKGRLQYLYDRVVGSDKMVGVERVYFPGELEQICAKVSEQGILDRGVGLGRIRNDGWLLFFGVAIDGIGEGGRGYPLDQGRD